MCLEFNSCEDLDGKLEGNCVGLLDVGLEEGLQLEGIALG